MARKKVKGGFSPAVPEPAKDAAVISSDSFAPKEDEEKERNGKYDLEALLHAEEIRNDPERMKHAKAHGEKQMGKIRSIQDIKDVAEAKYGAGKKKK